MSNNLPRGIDHIGLTVLDLAGAERFIIDGLGGEYLYELLSENQPPLSGPEVEAAIGLPFGAQVNAVRMYRLGEGPGIELFHYSAPEQRDPARASDLGWQHIGLYVDDLRAAVERAMNAGAVLLAEPWDMIGPEAGAGNRFCFLRAPFGALVEFVTYPTQIAPGANGSVRWKPQPTNP